MPYTVPAHTHMCPVCGERYDCFFQLCDVETGGMKRCFDCFVRGKEV